MMDASLPAFEAARLRLPTSLDGWRSWVDVVLGARLRGRSLPDFLVDAASGADAGMKDAFSCLGVSGEKDLNVSGEALVDLCEAEPVRPLP